MTDKEQLCRPQNSVRKGTQKAVNYLERAMLPYKRNSKKIVPDNFLQRTRALLFHMIPSALGFLSVIIPAFFAMTILL